MRRFFLAVILFFSFFIQPVRAQTAISIDQMNLKIWPEYDQPSALVIMDFFLATDVDLPAKVSIKLPAAAVEPHSVAVRELDGQLYVLDYELQSDRDWVYVSFTAPYTEIWLEYYDPSIEKDGGVRTYTYQWAADQAVGAFNIEVQQPRTATQITFDRNLGSGTLGSDNLRYYSASLGAVPTGSSFALKLTYTKPDDILSFTNEVAVQPSEPLTVQTQGRIPFVQLLPYLLGGLGLFLLILSIFWYLSNKTTSTQARKNRIARKRPASLEDDEDAVYCHQCGKRAGFGDLFCRACGAKLKVEE